MELNNQNTVTEDSGSRKNEIPMNQRYTLSLNEAGQYFHIGVKRLRRLAECNISNFSVRYGHKKRTVKFYEGRKLILLVQIIRCTVIHEDQTEEQCSYLRALVYRMNTGTSMFTQSFYYSLRSLMMTTFS